MPEAKDTLLRLFSLLRLIPEYPRYSTAPTLHEKLRDRGFYVDLRTVQRDLQRLSGPFSLIDEEEGGRKQWSHAKNAPLDLRDMEPATALALYLAEGHLKNLLPQSVLDLLDPQFNKARNYLGELEQNHLGHWARSVRALPNGKALLPAAVDAEVWQEASTALLERKQLRVTYLSRSKAETKVLILHPAGLVSRHSTSYLIGSVDGYDDLRQFALHRILRAEALDAASQLHPRPDIDSYIASGAFTWRQAPESVELVADVHPQVAWLLSETPLSTQQTLTPIAGSDWQHLQAHVPLDQETLWWIFGLNENIRVHAPTVWVQEIRQRIARMNSFYENTLVAASNDHSPHAQKHRNTSVHPTT
ncbi:helix-turn-helix transcriptional regulator [Ectopseudomonas mendocina]|uniref:helix-turn-helix transcriptional regulator n=1 Tax=Ectopseudomonas mendocina TaxID=300 RepID=UPI000206E36F|nr:WYL domain-containing protein [Pseudomonas mendocina]AEB60489.1 transcriptional factor [Pseudomonas mendocina NK-01]